MNISIDMAYKSRFHHGEELCGDKVEIVDNDDCRILILADGMGHGVRANILATLTSKIIATLMKNKIDVVELVPTIAKTLPLSSVNNAAYSTFSVIQVFHDGEVYIVEYDNPECMLIRNGEIRPLPFTYRTIEGKRIRECRFPSQLGDCLMICSDGCLYCGKDQVLNYRWNWNALSEYAFESYKRTGSAQQMADRVTQKCYELYGNLPTDDTTVGIVRIVEEKAINLLTGPPADKEDDSRMVSEFMEREGVKIVAGGITSHMVARELGEELVMDVGKLDPEIPPTSKINGIDLVTEGVLTLNKVIELLEQYVKDDVSVEFFEELSRENGATRMTCYFMEDCTTVNLFVGKAVNKDYSDKTLPFDISARQNLVKKLEDVLARMHKNVNVYYY